MSEVNDSVSTPIQTPTHVKSESERLLESSQAGDSVDENGPHDPPQYQDNKPISPPIPSPQINASEPDDSSTLAAGVATTTNKHELDEKLEDGGSPKKHKVDDSTADPDTTQTQQQQQPGEEEAGSSQDGSSSKSNEQLQSEQTEQQQTEQQQQPLSQMEPAPKPPAEPDMDNLPEVPMPKHQTQYALRVLKIIKRMKDAGPFLQPVDTIKLKIPLYYNFIKRPMDLSTMERKLNANAYTEIQEYVNDFNLMVENCARFNGAESAIAKMGRNIQASFEKHMLNLPPKDLPTSAPKTTSGRRKTSSTPAELNASGVPTIRRDSTANGRPKREIHPPKPKDMPYDTRPRKKKYVPELRFCQQVLKELLSKKYESFNYPFLEPVDPVALNCPTYFDYVKEPMDLSTVQNKLNNNQYENADEFEHDIRLIFHDCYVFNPEGTAVNMMGHRLEAIFEKKWVDRPVTPATPQHNSEDEFVSSEESEEEIDESQVTNPEIKFLEVQLEAMKQQLAKVKREEVDRLRKEKGLKKKKKVKRRRRRSDDSSIVVTYDMKKELSEKINELPEKKLNQVLTIISESLNLNNQNGDEIELDMDQLDNSTLLKLYNFVVKKRSSNGSSNRRSSNKKAKKNRNLSEAEQSKQIETIKKKLELLDQGNNNTNTSYSRDSDDDSDDDLSSESSEEE